MIKIITSETCKTFWKGDEGWDTENISRVRIYFVGVKIWDREVKFYCEPVENIVGENSNGIGFKKR